MTEKRQRLYGKIMAGFLILTMFLTFFSKTIYRSNLPVVELSFPMTGQFIYTVEGAAFISYSDIWNLYGEYSGRIREILVCPGEKVNEGDPLMILQPDTGEENIEIPAPQEGVVLSVEVEKGMYVAAQQNVILAVMADASNRWEVSFKAVGMSADRVAEDFLAYQGLLVTVEIRGMADKLQGSIISMEPFLEEDGETGYSIKVAFECGDNSIAGKKAEVTVRKPGGYYDAILPAGSLHRDASGYYVLTLKEEHSILGDNYVVNRVSVDLLDVDEISVALLGVMPDMPVIISDATKLVEGDRVKYEG